MFHTIQPNRTRFSYRVLNSSRGIIGVFYDRSCVAKLAPFRGGWVWQSHNPTLDALYPNQDVPALGITIPLVCGRTIYPTQGEAQDAAKTFIRAIVKQ